MKKFIEISVLCCIVLTSCNKQSSSKTDAPPTQETQTLHYKEARNIQTVFTALKNQFQLVPGVDLCLNPPATDNDIKQFEATIGMVLPDDVRQLYLLANGQQDGSNCFTLFYDGMQFMSLESAQQAWKFMMDLGAEKPGEYDGAVYPAAWLNGWIPIGYMINGDYLVVDMNPTPLGKKGQILDLSNEELPESPVAQSITDYLGYTEHQLATEKWRIDVETHSIIEE